MGWLRNLRGLGFPAPLGQQRDAFVSGVRFLRGTVSAELLSDCSAHLAGIVPINVPCWGLSCALLSQVDALAEVQNRGLLSCTSLKVESFSVELLPDRGYPRYSDAQCASSCSSHSCA